MFGKYGFAVEKGLAKKIRYADKRVWPFRFDNSGLQNEIMHVWVLRYQNIIEDILQVDMEQIKSYKTWAGVRDN